MQVIMGDATDNIPGLKGFGPEKARQFLVNYRPGEFISATLRLYMKEMGQLAGTCAFVESWNLVALRTSRGTWFRKKYELMFSTKDLLLSTLNPDVK